MSIRCQIATASSSNATGQPLADELIDRQLVVASPDVLDERVPCDHHAGAAIPPEPAHRPQPCLQPAMVALNAIVGVLVSAMPGRRQQRSLADIYRMAVTSLPGQSDLDVQPHPWLPNTYTVPLFDGHLLEAVLERCWNGRGWKASSATILEAAGPMSGLGRRSAMRENSALDRAKQIGGGLGLLALPSD